ncbi:putative ATP-dependent RNA helicase DHX36-like [Tropilaelaps mercedesae]|uniref:Putative ATP-dependent RNA helicase DHX36-like n=1 Tax=Tropilaelaps mercedesae TaxID=418985 RepID=A0A1V9X233_9ACAR|nr:putative ATP-dependent RNA helicase DHX36-like [Tropilaelaps mercedesae]
MHYLGDNKPPPGLRGREIGMWYARRSRARLKTENSPKTVVIPHVDLECSLRTRLELALRRVEEAVNQKSHLSWKDREITMTRLGEVNSRGTDAKKRRRPNFALNETRRKLPMFARRNDVLRAINENQVCVISAETGSGKTTQVPQYIIEQFEERHHQPAHQPGPGGDKGCDKWNQKIPGCFVVCTQPRRISAISVAERVANERGETVGERSVGYKIRLENRAAPVTPNQPVILYCTTGIVLQCLQSDPLLSCVTHLIVDEVHERSLHSDLLLAIVKEKILPVRPDFRLICMSATLDSDSFVRYFGPECAHLNVSGRVYPVADIYLEDFVLHLNLPRPPEKMCWYRNQRLRKLQDYGYPRDVITATLRSTSPNGLTVEPQFVVAAIKWICQQANAEDAEADGAILVFLPGWDVITSVCMELENVNCSYLNNRNRMIIPLHSMLPTHEQKLVFVRPPLGVRKIIVSTMIAEASVTIEDVVYVIDSGKTKLTTIEVEKNNQSRFGERWIAQANAKQRLGRAGRVRAGKCYKLYTRMDYNEMDQFEQPEMARTRLEDVVLYVKQLKLGAPEDFLPKCITPPEKEAVLNSVRFLEQLGALELSGCITTLGKCLCALSVEPRLGKLLLLASIFGEQCLQSALSIAACLAFKDPFFTPMGKSQSVNEVRAEFARKSGKFTEFSDHAMLATVVWESRGKHSNYLQGKFLSSQTLKMVNVIREQFQRQLSELGLMGLSKSVGPTKTRTGQGTLRAVICGGLYPGVGRGNFQVPYELRDRVGEVVACESLTMKCLSTQTAQRAKFHPKSILDRQSSGLPSALFAHYLAQLSEKAGCVMLHESTPVDHLPLLLFASAADCVYNSERERFTVNGWLELSCDPHLAHLIKRARSALNFVLEACLISGNTPGASSQDQMGHDSSIHRYLLDELVFVFESRCNAKMMVVYSTASEGDEVARSRPGHPFPSTTKA